MKNHMRHVLTIEKNAISKLKYVYLENWLPAELVELSVFQASYTQGK